MTNAIHAIIVDDEYQNQILLKELIQSYTQSIQILNTFNNVRDAAECIDNNAVDVVFLDIEMPEHSGLEILNHINKENYNFEIIFVTAYSEYAIQAFQLSAIDYLLKPLRPSQLKEAVEKSISQIGKSQISLKLEELKKSLQSSNFKKIGIPYSDGIKFVNFEDIIMLEADGMYTNVSIKNMDVILVSKPLRFFADLLFAIIIKKSFKFVIRYLRLLKYSIFSIKLEVFRQKKCYLCKVFCKTLIRLDFLGSVF